MNKDLLLNLSSIDSQERSEALKKFEIIKPFLEDSVPLAKISRTTGVASRTLWRWVSAYNEKGLLGLTRQKRLSSKSSIPTEMHEFIEGLALQSSGRTTASIKREVDKFGTQRNWPTVSYNSVIRIVKKLDARLVSLAHEGSKRYSHKFDLVQRRESNRQNEIWQADHTQLDCWLLNDDGLPVRPWLGIILDDYSRAVSSFNVSFDAPCTLRTALMLRQAIWRKSDPRYHIQGIPERFYTDSGSDFTSKHMEQVAADIKMRLIFSQKGQPRGRGKIERFFQTVNELFLCHVPGNTLTAFSPKASINLAQFKSLFENWLLDDYQNRIHSEIKKSPKDKWEENVFLPRLPESLEQLDLLLLTVATPRKVQPDGIYFQKLRYTSPTLAPYVKESVVIRYDPQDLAEIRVFYKNHFLCRAICNELESKKVSLKEIISARNKQRRDLKSKLNERQKLVESFVRKHNLEPYLPIEALRKETKLASGLKVYEID